jgi:hypothetical protein
VARPLPTSLMKAIEACSGNFRGGFRNTLHS